MDLRLRSFVLPAAAALLISLCSHGDAGEYYQWTDERGNLHISDSLENVPAKYRKQVTSRKFGGDEPADPEPPVNGRPDARPPALREDERAQGRRYEVPYTPYE